MEEKVSIKDFELEPKTVLEIGKFSILWNMFEREFCNYGANHRTVKDNTTQIVFDDNKVEAFLEELKYRRYMYQQDIEDYVEKGYFPQNTRVKSDDREEEITYIINFIKGTKEEKGCIFAIMRIRNNLMHGIKEAKQLDGQYHLFKAANGVLESITKKEC